MNEATSIPENSHISLKDLFIRLIINEKAEWLEKWKRGYLEFVIDIQKLRVAISENPDLSIDNVSLYTELSPAIQSYESFMYKWLMAPDNLISAKGQSVLSYTSYENIVNDNNFKLYAKKIILAPTIVEYNGLVKWWYENQAISNNPLRINRAFAGSDPVLLTSTVHDKKFWRVTTNMNVSFGFVLNIENKGNWFLANQQLTAWLDNQLEDVLVIKSSNRLEQIIWRNIFVWLFHEEFTKHKSILPNQLIKREKPHSGNEAERPQDAHFKGVDIDFLALAQEQKALGDAGEKLVMNWEISHLKQKGYHDKASLVRKVKDGEGYDILSFDKNGNEKYIEVKTTTKNEKMPFYMSNREIEFMQLHQNQYSIYRLYHYDRNNNSAEYFELSGNVENQLTFEAKQYQVSIRKT